jgi:glycerol-3-phosphate dehydrogenase
MNKHQPKWLLSRTEQFDLLCRESFDVLVIGGGAVGAGIALDATSRGLKTALVEAHDFSSGTSSRSTKLVHGGVRYLENAVKNLDIKEYSLVRDALIERKNFLHNAPHLTNRLPLITPVYSWFEASYYLMGLKLYDFLSGRASLGKSQFLSSHETIAQFPMVNKTGLKGSVLFYDGQFDDARMNITLILSAIREGAVAINYAPAIGLIKKYGAIIGAEVQDQLTKIVIKVSAKVVINATGSFTDHIRRMDDIKSKDMITMSQGSHIVLDKKFSPKNLGLIIPKTKDGRVLFVLPWLSKTIVGTTDLPTTLSENPKASMEEVNYILNYLNEYYDQKITSHNILATFSGLRPLANSKSSKQNTASLSRDHVIEVKSSNLITIAGGKWTTYRIMAEDTIDTAILKGFIYAQNKSKTKNLKLVGAKYYKNDLYKNLMADHKLPTDIAMHLASSYGDQAYAVLGLAKKSALERLVSNYPFIEVEIEYAVKYEYALHAMDVLARRLRLAFLDNAACIEALPKVIDIMTHLLSWDQTKKQTQWDESMTMLATFI